MKKIVIIVRTPLRGEVLVVDGWLVVRNPALIRRPEQPR